MTESTEATVARRVPSITEERLRVLSRRQPVTVEEVAPASLTWEAEPAPSPAEPRVVEPAVVEASRFFRDFEA